MPRNSVLLLGAAMLLGTTHSNLVAAELFHGACAATVSCGPARCPDDYCPKPWPCLNLFTKACCPDDYRCKPLPCVAPLCHAVCCDDYCRHPLPQVCCAPPPVPYTCGPLGHPVPVCTTCPPTTACQPSAPQSASDTKRFVTP